MSFQVESKEQIAEFSKFSKRESIEIVKLIYQLAFNREADDAGLQLHSISLESGGFQYIINILKSFLESAEFNSVKLLLESKDTLEDNIRFEILEDKLDTLMLFEKTAQYWRNQASKPDEIYWSVLTNQKYRGVMLEDVRKEFMDTGKPYCDRLSKLVSKFSSLPLSEQEVLDFGCGVGRLSVHFSSRYKKVYCVDFSNAHLEEAKQNCRLASISNAEFWFLESLDSMIKLPKVDIIYSFIVLQHNTPPVMAFLIHRLLECLNPGGLAFLHVPLAGLGYKFSKEDYLKSQTAGKSMEMHILPKSNLNEIAHQSNCKIVESECIGGTGAFYSEEVIFKKL